MTPLPYHPKPLPESAPAAAPAERTPDGRIMPTFAARVIHTWSDGEDLSVDEWAVCEGSPPEGWSRFQTVITLHIDTPRGQFPYKKKLMIPGSQPLEALRWLALNVQEQAKKIQAEALEKMQAEARRIIAAPRGHRLAGA